MLKRVARFGAIAICATAVSVVGGTASAQPSRSAVTAIEEWVEALGETPGVEASYETLTGGGSAAVLTGLVISGREFEMTFEPITMTGYSSEAPAGFSFASLGVGRVEMRTPESETVIVNMTIDDLVVPNTEFAYNPERPISSILDLWGDVEAISLGELAIGRIDMGINQGGLNSVVSYHNYVVSGIANGRVESTSAGPLIMNAPSPDELFVLTVDELSSEDTDIGALIRVLDPAAYDGNRDWHTFVGHVAYDNILLSAPDIELRIRAIELDDFRMRQAAEPFTAILERLMVEAEDLTSREADEMMQSILLDLVSPWGIGAFSIRGIDLFADDIDRFHIGEFYFEDLSLDGLGELGVDDVDIVIGGEGSLRLEHAALGDLAMPSEETLQRLIDATAANEELDDITDFLPTLGFFEVGGFSFGEPEQHPITVGRLLATTEGPVGPIFTASIFQMEDVAVPLSFMDGEIRQVLNQLGYTEFSIDLGLRMAWDEADETLIIDDIAFNIDGVGSITAAIELGGITRAILENPDAVSEEELLGISLIRANVLINDDSVADRLFQWTAEGNDTPAEQYRKDFIAGLQFYLIAIAQVPAPVAQQVTPPIQQFLREPGALSIRLEPEEPLSLAVLDTLGDGSPYDLFDLLGVTLEALPPQ